MKKSAFFIFAVMYCCILPHFFNCAFASEAPSNNIAFYTHTIGLEPIPNSYQTAKSTFLPDRFDDLGMSGFNSIGNTNVYTPNTCLDYTLSSCPDNALCSVCPTSSQRYKLISCRSGFNASGNTCIAASCSSAGYYASVPSRQICTKISLGALTCYNNCRAVSCSGYSISCSSMPENAQSVAKCGDCNSDASNCDDNVCKVSQCANGYKIANGGTACIALDDTCPDGYYKECETGTQGDPQYTEAGSACYQCKPKPVGCPSGTLDLNNYWCNGALQCFLKAD